MIGRKGKGVNVKHARHGDVCIEVLNEKPTGWEGMEAIKDNGGISGNGLTVAYGETTGHSHTLTEADILDSRRSRDSMGREHIYAQVKGKPKIKHQEHDPIEFEESDTWLHFISQYEYDPEQVRRVRD